ncbi:MAG TPA: hypothetical protein VF425_03555 [Thermoanaerobaculia bacterium]
MRKNLAIVTAFACLVAASGSAFAVGEGKQMNPGPPAVGYACVPVPKSGDVKVVKTPPPPGFKCPAGQKLLLLTQQMEDKLAASPKTEFDGPGGAPDLSSPPGPNQQEVKAPKKKTRRWKQCINLDGGWHYCCYNSYSNCGVE